MSHIPTEVLHEIFIRLDLKDRVKCMLVCRFWYDTLDRLTLLYHLSVDSPQFSKLIGMLARFSYRATQVECLELSTSHPFNFDKRELCNMFPNLRKLDLAEYYHKETQVHTMNEPFQFMHATCKLEKIREFGQSRLTPHLAMSNMCNNLKSLFLESSIDSNVISQLRNMPVLEYLGMNGVPFKLMDLEILHSNLPSLKRFSMVTAKPLSGEIPQNIVPARLITELSLEIASTENPDAHIQFYKYCCSKYLSVTKLEFSDLALLDEDRPNIPRIYNEGVFALYQKLGSHVNTFALNNYCAGLDAFRKFDEFGMHLKELTISVISNTDEPPFIEELVQSQQTKYIKKLELEDIVPESISMMNRIEALETLYIFSNCLFNQDLIAVRRPINFTQLINACHATLTTLRLEHMNLKYDGLTSNITCIKNLAIINVEFTPMLANIIETSFPKLSILQLKGEITNDVTISLLNHNLKGAHITAMYDEDEDPNDYKIESKCEEGIRCHMLKRVLNKTGQLNSIDNTASVQEPGPSFTLKFICPSVKQPFFSTEEKEERYL